MGRKYRHSSDFIDRYVLITLYSLTPLSIYYKVVHWPKVFYYNEIWSSHYLNIELYINCSGKCWKLAREVKYVRLRTSMSWNIDRRSRRINARYQWTQTHANKQGLISRSAIAVKLNDCNVIFVFTHLVHEFTFTLIWVLQSLYVALGQLFWH